MKVTNSHARLIVAAVLAATASGANAIAGEVRIVPGVNEIPTKETDPKAQFTEAQIRDALAGVEGVEVSEATDVEVKEPPKAPAAKTAKASAPAAAPAAGGEAAAGGAGWAPAKT
jgi:hypothetical protein